MNSKAPISAWRHWKFAFALGVYGLSLLFMLGFLFLGYQNGEFLFSRVNFGDNGVYYSWAAHIKNGGLNYDNYFTNDMREYIAINLWFTFLGKLAVLTNSVPVSFEIGRAIGATASVYMIAWLAELLAPSRKAAIFATFFCVVSAGLTGLLRLRGRYGLEFTGIDYLQPEVTTSRILYMSPLFAVSLALMLLCIIQSMLFLRNGERKHVGWAIISGLLLANIHPYEIVSLVAIYVALVTLMVFSGKGSDAIAFIRKFLLPWGLLVGFLFSLTYWMQLLSGVKELRQDARMDSYGLFQTVIGFGMPLFLSILALVLLRAKKLRFSNEATLPTAWLLISWFLAQNLLSRVPSELQRRLLLGAEIPIGLLGGMVVLALWEMPNCRFRIAAGLGFLGSLPSTFMMFREEFHDMRALRDVSRRDSSILRHADREAVEFVRSHTKKEDTVQFVGSPKETLFFFLPALAERHLYVGHWMETRQYDRKRRALDDIFDGEVFQPEARKFLKESGIDFIVFVPDTTRPLEKKSLDALVRDGVLTRAFASADASVEVYKVSDK